MAPEARVHAWALPGHLPGPFGPGSAAVVVDVLRATTSIALALDHGAAAVVPAETACDARARAGRRPGSLLAGERGGLRIDGFDLGNSPAEFTPERVGGRTVVMSTTNGTRAILAAASAEIVLAGALVNRSPTAARLAGHDGPVHVVCAGTDGAVSLDDCLAAGAIIARLEDLIGPDALDDAAALMRDAWHHACAGGGPLDALRACGHGRRLIELGMASDVELACRVDAAPVVCRHRFGAVVREGTPG